MKKGIYIFVAGIALLAIIAWQHNRIKVIGEERNVYRNDVYGLLSETQEYRTKDSLQAASIVQLSLTVNEYEKYKQSDLKLIETLQVDKKRLRQITTAQTQTIHFLQGSFKDSIVYRDNYITDTLKCIEIHDKWFDMAGCIEANSKFAGRFENRDSLLYVEHIVPKRFWFIKWGVKERRQEIVSRNPNTRIVGAQFVTIRK